MTAEALFDGDFLRRLETLRLVSRRLKPAGLQGEHRVRQRGSGMEFADYRPYVAGDDIRNVDWPTYLRLDKLLVRLFEEEGDLSIYLFLDASRSMAQGDEQRFLLARRLAAALGYIGLYNLDRVSVVAFAQGMRESLAELRGHRQVFRLFRFLTELQPAGSTDLARAVADFFAVPRRRGLVIPISDFLEPSWAAGLRHIARLRHDALVLQMRSPEAPDLPHQALVVDSETDVGRRLRVTPELLRRYAEAEAGHSRELEQTCRRYGFAYLEVASDQPVDELLLQVFKKGHLLR